MEASVRLSSSVLLRLMGGLYLSALSLVMAAPIVIVVLVSFSPSPVFDLPTHSISLQWYRKLLTLDSLWPAVGLSLQIAAVTTSVSLVLGTLCAIGIQRGSFRGRDTLLTLVLSPMMLPGVVIGIGMLQTFRSIGIEDGYKALMLGHIVLTLPYIVRILYGSLQLFDYSMVDAARTLGYSHGMALVKVLVPNLGPALVTSGMFAFLTSVDNYALALFLGDVRNVTLPIQILKYLDQASDPSVAAIASIMVLATILVLVVAERLVGMRRLMGG
ncbi:MAG: ABC transporter permease [Lautropia sp.]